MADLISAVRQQPDKWMAGIPAAGAPSHLATLMWARQAQVKLNYVPYKGTQPALMDVAGGHTDLLMDSMISLLPMVKGGKVRPIAITSAKRSALAPDVPTIAESGLPNFAYASWYGVWAAPVVGGGLKLHGRGYGRTGQDRPVQPGTSRHRRHRAVQALQPQK
jgi:tripartite-type tricarboxylate transporter receptor subunit TctC